MRFDLKSGLHKALEFVGEPLAELACEAEMHGQLNPWHPISTAPNNQNLEVEIVRSGKRFAIPFPCQKLNSAEWINSDLGLRVPVDPTRWRPWSYRAPPVDQSKQVPPNGNGALFHADGKIAR